MSTLRDVFVALRQPHPPPLATCAVEAGFTCLRDEKPHAEFGCNQVVPTAIVTVAVSVAIVGLVFFIIGKTHSASAVMLLPAPVLSGFLGCIG